MFIKDWLETGELNGRVPVNPGTQAQVQHW